VSGRASRSDAADDAPVVHEGSRHVIGLDGGGTYTRIALADLEGRELVRRTGPPGLIDPRHPGRSGAALVRLVRETADAAATTLPVAGLCAGLAGAGSDEARRVVRRELAASGVAARLAVIQDGEIALEGALAGEAGILLVAGTGSVALGRAEDGRIERCGGWGMLVGDEGSGYTIARAALRAALQAADGRGEPTRLLPELLDHLGLSEPRELVEWVGRTEKA
jgi:glucosamine kinase